MQVTRAEPGATVHGLQADAWLGKPGTRPAALQSAIDLMAQGAVRAPRPTRMRLEQARDAHLVLDAGQTQGKIILEP